MLKLRLISVNCPNTLKTLNRYNSMLEWLPDLRMTLLDENFELKNLTYFLDIHAHD